MRELMLELLTYEPYGQFLPVDKIYINDILSGNCQQPQSMLHDLFSGFHQYVQRANFEKKKGTRDTMKADIDWLLCWKNTYHQNKNAGRVYYPLLFKKICFYLMVNGEFSESDFMAQIGLQVSRIRKWKISPQFRKYAETDTYSTIRLFRNGVKKRYIVSVVKKLYYEAGRQESQSMTLKKLPTFVDVFAGTGSVAASVVSEGCPPPIVNDYDPVMVCFAWAFTHRRNEMCKRIAEYHNYLMNLDFKSINWPYSAEKYEEHYNDPKNLLTTPEAWDNPKLEDFWEYPEDYIEGGKMLAWSHKEFIMRARSSYLEVERLFKSWNRDELRKEVGFNNSPPHSIAQISRVLYYALVVFYYYSFRPSGPTGNVYYQTNVDTSSYLSYLRSLKVNLDTVKKKKNIAVKARALMELHLQASSLFLESTGHFSRYLRDAEFYCKDFEELLQDDSSNRIYYLDSPYFLTVGYKIGFFDEDHKRMLDSLRGAKFKWIFSMQYNLSDMNKCTTDPDEKKRRSQPHIIKDYEAYYRGFYAPFQLDADQKTYVATDAPMEDAEGLYVLLFDFDKVKQKWREMKTKTSEMLVVNFNPLRTIPLHDSACVLPFNLFLQCADKKMAYQNIVKRAVAWRKDNIESKYADEVPV